MVLVPSIWECMATQDCRDYYSSTDRKWDRHTHIVFGGMFTVEVRLQSSNTPWTYSTYNPVIDEFTVYNPEHYPITPFYGKDLKLL